jgi:hypothetical protein
LNFAVAYTFGKIALAKEFGLVVIWVLPRSA